MKIEMTAIENGSRPMEGSPHIRQDGWLCTLQYEGREMEVEFWMGEGLKRREPRTDEVLYCLLSDARYVRDYPDFIDFANELGYDDMKHARAVHAKIQEQIEDLENLFGDKFESLLELGENGVRRLVETGEPGDPEDD